MTTFEHIYWKNEDELLGALEYLIPILNISALKLMWIHHIVHQSVACFLTYGNKVCLLNCTNVFVEIS